MENEILEQNNEELNIDELVANALEESKVDTGLTDETVDPSGTTVIGGGQLALMLAGVGLITGAAVYGGIRLTEKVCDKISDAWDKHKAKRAAKKAAKEAKVEVVTLDENGEEVKQ